MFAAVVVLAPLMFVPVTSELMFAQYSVPSVAYCVDGIMSHYQSGTPNALVLSFNTASTSIIPVLRGKGILSHAKRYVYLVCLRDVPPRSYVSGYRGAHLKQQTTCKS